MLSMSPNTERRYRQALEPEGLLSGDPEALPALDALRATVIENLGDEGAAAAPSSVDHWRDDIEAMTKRGAGPTAIHDALRLKDDYQGSLSVVKRMALGIKASRGVSADDVVIPVLTAPGEVAEVDFGCVGKLDDPTTGTARKAWIFVMVLGFSRHMYVRIVFDQTVRTWIDCHQRAFVALDGVPRVVVPDNLKSAVIRAAFSPEDDIELNRSYRDIARHFGFKIDPTLPRSPKHKGKVESGVKYVKNNFFKPRDFSDGTIESAQRELDQWQREIAAERIHGTTGRRPREVFDSEEKSLLLPLPRAPFEMAEWKKTKVHTDSHVLFGGRMYSVPWRFIGNAVWIKGTPSTVLVYANDVRIATHQRRGLSQRSTVENHLPEGRRDYRERHREYWEKKAVAMAPAIGEDILGVFDSDGVLLQLRTAQNILRHLEGFPRERAIKACERAHYYSNFKYGEVKDILHKGLDRIPLPIPAPAPQDPAAPLPRFARQASDIVNPNLEFFVNSTGDKNGYH